MEGIYAHQEFLSLPQVPNLLKPVCIGVAGSELGMVGGLRLGSG